ncbi:tail collar domain [Volucribacter psittacicida]|uniref:Tail collar domain n=1 Tax=Volucribacter psittacicida TaxID=203482 RepID=A0A4R1FX47_9PAST|nr:tail fiber protein [Volucribacter psittacicida]TCJ95971.1 tail collar domain [Volucribacter psittacicida]
MANLKEQNKWETGIYRIEESDPVLGGENGVSNKPLKQLANRTFYLNEIAKAIVARAITAGNGLTGGGTLGASRTISLGTPSKITATSTNVAGGNTHTHEIDKASTSVAGVVKLNDSLTSNANNEALTARQGKLLNENKAEKTEVMPLQQASLSATDDLNDFRQDGVFRQTSSARASVERNYPEAAAGILEVLYGGYYQRYTLAVSSVCYHRCHRSGSWQAWQRVDGLDKVNRAGDTITGNLTVNANLSANNLALNFTTTNWNGVFFNLYDNGSTHQGGQWRMEFNPKSSEDTRLNIVYKPKVGEQKYIAFPTLNSNRETVAYQSWVSEQAKIIQERSITAGNGLTGGGTLGASRTISLGTPSKITATSTNVAGGNTHTHEIDKASTSVAGVVKLNDSLTSNANNEALTARQGKLLNENKAEKAEVMPLQQVSLSATDDLNDFRQDGIFRQTSSARASVERNYPEAAAGILEVLYGGYYQRYTLAVSSVCYHRCHRSGSWQAWQRVDGLDKVNRSGDTITGDLKVNKTLESGYRIQIVRNEERFVPYMNVRNEAIEADSNTTDRHMTDFNMQCLRGGAEKTKALIRSYLLSDKTSRVHFMASNASDQYQNNMVIHGTGNSSFGTATDNNTDRLQVNGSIGANTLNLYAKGNEWLNAKFNLSNGGNWRLEVNPNSETDPRINFVYTKTDKSTKYIAFPTVNLGRETVAYQSWVEEQIKKSLPLGSIVGFPKEITNPAGFLKCDGSIFAQASYPDLYKAMGNKNTLPNLNGEIGQVAPFAVNNLPEGWIWFDEISSKVKQTNHPELYRLLIAQYGSLAKVPKLGDRFIRNIGSNLTIGQLQDDEIKRHRHLSNWGEHNSSSQDIERDTSKTIKGAHGSDNDNANYYTSYTGGDETRPKAIAFKFAIKATNAVNYWIKAYGEVINTGSLDAANLALALQGKADKNHTHTFSDIINFSQGVANSISSSKTENGWCKLPNGLIMMWGNFKTGRIGNEIKGDVIFPIAFPNMAFSVTLSGAHGTISSGGASWEGFSISELTNAKFQWHSSWQSRSTEQGESKIYWFAVGY